MDADVYGPNVPLMMGINQTPLAFGERIQPLDQYGVKLMSMGFLNPGDKPLVWRGPMLHSVIQQFLRGVDWGDLDYLVIDLPPGTGDVRSEEHTSELQSLRHLVCRLLLEKKQKGSPHITVGAMSDW